MMRSGNTAAAATALVAAAAFLLFAAPQALAFGSYRIDFEGAGSGWVKGGEPEGEGGGIPYVNCHWNGETQKIDVAIPPGSGECTGGLDNVGLGLLVFAEADPGSEFVGWEVPGGVPFGGCENPASPGEECAAISPGKGTTPIEIKAIFNDLGPPYKLNLSTSGNGSGSFKCKLNGGAEETCKAEYKEGQSVQVVPHPSAGSEFKEWTHDCSGSGECKVTLNGDHIVGAVFDLQPEGVSVTVEGEVPITTSLEGCESPVVLGPFIPAVAANYEGTCTVTATSTGNASELSAADGDASAAKGHLVQGSYRLPSALETRANGLAGLEFPGTGGPFAPLTSKVTLLTYGGPVSADNVTVHFKQHIGLHDALHTGTYAKTITLTLEQTTL